MKVARYGLYRLVIAIALWVYGLATCEDVFSVALTFPLFVFICTQMYGVRRPEFTPEDMLWLCSLLFFVVAPCQRIIGYGFISGPTQTLEYEVGHFVGAQFILLLSLMTFAVLRARFSGARELGACDWVRPEPGAGISAGNALLVFGLIVVSFALYVVFSGGISNVISPRRLKQADDVNFIRVAFLAVEVVGTMLLGLRARHVVSRRGWGFVNWLMFVIALVLLAVAVNPFNNSRFFIIASWLPLFMIVFGRFARHELVYGAVVLSILFIMPILSMSTRGGLEALSTYGGARDVSQAWKLRDMDVFDTLVHAVRFSEYGLAGWGRYSLAILLFFVPRSLWSGKPQVAGLDVGRDLHVNFFAGTDNLSFFYGGDLFLDFSYPGVVLGFAVAAWLWVYLRQSRRLQICGINLAPIIMMAVTPIMLRGPVGSVIGYPFCLIVAVLLYSFLLGEKRRRMGFN